MAMWLYQLSQNDWPPNNYRLEVWEGERWAWPVRRMTGGDDPPREGDRVVFFYAPSRGSEAGFYGWAIVLDWREEERSLYFRAVAPSDQLKMHPWWEAPSNLKRNLEAGLCRGKPRWGFCS